MRPGPVSKCIQARFKRTPPLIRRPITSSRMGPGESSGSGDAARSGRPARVPQSPLAPHLPKSSSALRGIAARKKSSGMNLAMWGSGDEKRGGASTRLGAVEGTVPRRTRRSCLGAWADRRRSLFRQRPSISDTPKSTGKGGDAYEHQIWRITRESGGWTLLLSQPNTPITAMESNPFC